MTNDKPIISGTINLIHAPKEVIFFVESKLSLGGYLPKDQVNQSVGQNTLKALAEFKEDNYLEFPEKLGQTTIDHLALLVPKHPISEQSLNSPIIVNPESGSKTGKTAIIPVVGKVYANQYIIDNVPLTWGEVTKNLTRIPKSDPIVHAIMRVANVFWKIRDKVNTPLRVNSGYRPPEVNRAIGGARNSQHIFGTALDLSPKDGDYGKLLAVIKSIPEITGIGVAGAKKGFHHFDLRKLARGAKKVLWGY